MLRHGSQRSATDGLSARADGRGVHCVFLGYAVGVGKTRAMLAEGLRLQREGDDVVIGVLEAHGRAGIATRADQFERLVPLRVDYRGTVFDELDPQGVRRRSPGWLLVDELAHEAAPGTPYAERWQAVEEIRDAGIDVMSTLNVQHVESLNDFVFQVTGVRVRDTVPDAILGSADRIVLVDVPPEVLLDRVRGGALFDRADTGSALTHFFRRSTLEALRDKAQRVAESHPDHVRMI